MSTKAPAKRSGNASFEERQRKEVLRTEQESNTFLKSDQVNDFEDLTGRAIDFPSSWNIVSWKDEEKIVLEEVTFDEESKPKFAFSLTVFRSLKFVLVSGDSILPLSKVSHISKTQMIKRHSDISNLLAFLRSYKGTDKVEDVTEHCIRKLNAAIAECDENSLIFKKLSFIKSQLNLVKQTGLSRRYPPAFIWTALSWFKTSPALYRLLLSDGLMTLPSIGYLKQISGSFSLETGLSTSVISYLDTRIIHLEENQKTVSLLIDEVFSLYNHILYDFLVFIIICND